jgi:hypothetical protein
MQLVSGDTFRKLAVETLSWLTLPVKFEAMDAQTYRKTVMEAVEPDYGTGWVTTTPADGLAGMESHWTYLNTYES